MTEPVITRELNDQTLDAELASLLWLLVEAGVPLTVTGRPGGRHRLRSAIQALTGGAGWSVAGVGALEGAVHDAVTLDELLKLLAAPPHLLSEDQLRELGIVLVLDRTPGVDRRVVAAHYMRPVERDREGHLQRRPPALLSAWDESTGRLEHFAWGVTAELASRAGMSTAVFEALHLERAAFLGGLAAAGIDEGASMARALEGYRLLGATGPHEGH